MSKIVLGPITKYLRLLAMGNVHFVPSLLCFMVMKMIGVKFIGKVRKPFVPGLSTQKNLGITQPPLQMQA